MQQSTYPPSLLKKSPLPSPPKPLPFLKSQSHPSHPILTTNTRPSVIVRQMPRCRAAGRVDILGAAAPPELDEGARGDRAVPLAFAAAVAAENLGVVRAGGGRVLCRRELLLAHAAGAEGEGGGWAAREGWAAGEGRMGKDWDGKEGEHFLCMDCREGRHRGCGRGQTCLFLYKSSKRDEDQI